MLIHYLRQVQCICISCMLSHGQIGLLNLSLKLIYKVYCVYDIMKSYTSVCGVLSIVDICSHIACTRTVSLQYRSKFSLV